MWTVTEVDDPNDRRRNCEEIIAKLPNWFGIPDANASYIEGTGTRDAFVVHEGAVLVGMLSLSHPYPNNADIYWVGVLPDYHHRGIGRALFEAALARAKDWGCTSMTVETLSDSDPDEGYRRTREFYVAMGFKPLFELRPTNAVNPLMYMYRAVSSEKVK